MTDPPQDVVAAAGRLAARELATEGVEMMLALEDMRARPRAAGAAARADGLDVALRAGRIADALYPEASARDIEALARVLEIVAADDLELPR